jgi:cytidylate kinase
VQDLAARGVEASYDEILAQQTERDRRDSSRAVGRLMQTAEMIELVTDGLTPDEVVDRLEEIVRVRMRELEHRNCGAT